MSLLKTCSKGNFPRRVSLGFTYLQAHPRLDFLPCSFSPGAAASAVFGFTFSDVHRELRVAAAGEADQALPPSPAPSRPGPGNSSYTPTNLISTNTGAVIHGGGSSSFTIPKVKTGGCRP